MEINIIGMGEGKELVPQTGRRWGITRVIHEMPVDVLFDIHDPKKLDNTGLFLARKQLAKDKHILFYDTENYPLKKIIKEFGTDFFSNSVCYAIALAIHEGATAISLYGVNHSRWNKIEYIRQKPAVDFWIGMAIGRGVKVNIYGPMSEICKLYNGKLYGYEIACI